MDTVLVIGATGKTGSALLDLLRTRAEPARAARRTPNAADAIRFDWDEITTHGPALDGVVRVYLVPRPQRSTRSQRSSPSSPRHEGAGFVAWSCWVRRSSSRTRPRGSNSPHACAHSPGGLY